MPLPLIPILISAGASLAGGAIYEAAADALEDPIVYATPRDIDGVLAVLDACPVSDPAMRRYREDLLAQVSRTTAAEVYEARPRMLIEAQKRCAAALAAADAGRPEGGSGSGASVPPDTRSGQVPPPPEGAPSWYWLVFAALSALVVWRSLGGGRRK
jgi:hypothetical protein